MIVLRNKEYSYVLKENQYGVKEKLIKTARTAINKASGNSPWVTDSNLTLGESAKILANKSRSRVGGAALVGAPAPTTFAGGVLLAANEGARRGTRLLPKRSSKYGNRFTQGARNLQAKILKKSRKREQAAYNKVTARKVNVAPQVNTNGTLTQMEKAASYIEDFGLTRPLMKYRYL